MFKGPRSFGNIICLISLVLTHAFRVWPGSLITKAKSQPEKVQQVLDKVRTDGVISTYEAGNRN